MRWRAAAVAVLLAACATTVEPPPATFGRPADFPDADYQELRSGGAPVYRVDPAGSRVVVVVRRGGTLAQFGHDHVVASHDVGGFVAPSAGRADLYVPLDALVVDPPALRSESGLETRPSADDIAATRRNMLERVLESGRFPYASVAVNRPPGEATQPFKVALTLRGVTRPIEARLQSHSAGDEVVATGSFAIDQSQFGIAPFSILGGAIAVKDRLDITFRIVARREQ